MTGNEFVLMERKRQRFRDEGCPNCEEFLHLAGSQDQIESCTSQVFEGLITLADPSKSWVAKWQRLDGYVPGVYAIKVSGQLPDEIRSALEDEYRIQYIPYASPPPPPLLLGMMLERFEKLMFCVCIQSRRHRGRGRISYDFFFHLVARG